MTTIAERRRRDVLEPGGNVGARQHDRAAQRRADDAIVEPDRIAQHGPGAAQANPHDKLGVVAEGAVRQRALDAADIIGDAGDAGRSRCRRVSSGVCVNRGKVERRVVADAGEGISRSVSQRCAVNVDVISGVLEQVAARVDDDGRSGNRDRSTRAAKPRRQRECSTVVPPVVSFRVIVPTPAKTFSLKSSTILLLRAKPVPPSGGVVAANVGAVMSSVTASAVVLAVPCIAGLVAQLHLEVMHAARQRTQGDVLRRSIPKAAGQITRNHRVTADHRVAIASIDDLDDIAHQGHRHAIHSTHLHRRRGDVGDVVDVAGAAVRSRQQVQRPARQTAWRRVVDGDIPRMVCGLGAGVAGRVNDCRSKVVGRAVGQRRWRNVHKAVGSMSVPVSVTELPSAEVPSKSCTLSPDIGVGAAQELTQIVGVVSLVLPPSATVP